MKTKKNTILGKNKTVFYQFIVFLIFYLFIIPLNLAYSLESLNKLEGDLVEIKILDKMSSKNSKLTLKIGEEKKFENLLIKALKCKNSEFDDNPEITAYLQVIDITNKKNDEVFVFNGWTFSSSPSLRPFDHPIYDIWLIKCFN
tara:strand:- start:480 stop:911 length:432 start_codon:yes stop_codon:yes gene_type:complete